MKGVRHKVRPPRQNFTKRGSLCGNMTDRIQNDLMLIYKNQIGVLSHQLQNQVFFPKIPEFVIMFNFKTHNPLQGRLCDRQNMTGSNMLPEKHAEVRRSHRAEF